MMRQSVNTAHRDYISGRQTLHGSQAHIRAERHTERSTTAHRDYISTKKKGEKAMSKKIVCQNCGEHFQFTQSAQQIYERNNWCEPKSCKACREKKKLERISPYYGLHEAMFNFVPTKNKHVRIQYSAF